jgi:hypothetical protein
MADELLAPDGVRIALYFGLRPFDPLDKQAIPMANMVAAPASASPG